MKMIKVSEATNIQLDWLVAKAEGLDPQYDRFSHGGVWYGWTVSYPNRYRHLPKFTTDPSHMWPIIEREKISTLACDHDWEAQSQTVPLVAVEGPTALIAAARCYVGSKMGEEVEVPDELA